MINEHGKSTDEYRKLNEMNQEVMEKHEEQEAQIEEKVDRLEELEKENNTLKSTIFVKDEECFKYKQQYEELMNTLQKFDYQGCSCNLRTLPAVSRARETILSIKPDKVMIS